MITIASVNEVRPNYHLLGEAKHTKSSTKQAVFINITRVSNQLGLFKQKYPENRFNIIQI